MSRELRPRRTAAPPPDPPPPPGRGGAARRRRSPPPSPLSPRSAREEFVYNAPAAELEAAAALATSDLAAALRRHVGGAALQPSNVASLLARRQLGSPPGCHPGAALPRREALAVATRYLPSAAIRRGLAAPRGEHPSRAYNVRYSASGRLLVVSSQDETLRVYGADAGAAYPLLAAVPARNVAWAVSSIDVSPLDERQVMYSSMSDTLHVVRLPDAVLRGDREAGAGAGAGAAAAAHVALPLADASHGGGDWRGRQFAVFQAVYSPDGTEALAACSDGALRVFDLEGGRVTERVPAHGEDINAVCFAEAAGARSNVLVSGSDDAMIKVWDRRSPAEPVGHLPGHTEGVTSLSPRGDGVYVLSNGKDQTARLWDLRRTASGAEVAALAAAGATGPRFGFDYRWQDYPGTLPAARARPPPARPAGADVSALVFRGHTVLQTLVRCHFSPDVATGGRFVYSGSADGGVWLYDALTAEVAAVLRGHEGVVRDVAWHPTRLSPHLASASWDGRVAVWGHDGDAAGAQRTQRRVRVARCAAVRARAAAQRAAAAASARGGARGGGARRRQGGSSGGGGAVAAAAPAAAGPVATDADDGGLGDGAALVDGAEFDDDDDDDDDDDEDEEDGNDDDFGAGDDSDDDAVYGAGGAALLFQSLRRALLGGGGEAVPVPTTAAGRLAAGAAAAGGTGRAAETGRRAPSARSGPPTSDSASDESGDLGDGGLGSGAPLGRRR